MKPNMIHAQLQASWRRQSRLLLDGIVRGRPANTQQNPGPVEDVLQERETIPDGWNSKREASNSQHDFGAIDKKEMIPSGWSSQREVSNVQHNPGPVKGALEKKIMITGGWNSQRKASITKQDPCHIEDAMKENEMIPGGWSRQREASNIEQYSGPVAGPLEEEMISGGLNIEKKLQESPNTMYEKSCQRYCDMCDRGLKFSDHKKKQMKHYL